MRQSNVKLMEKTSQILVDFCNQDDVTRAEVDDVAYHINEVLKGLANQGKSKVNK